MKRTCCNDRPSARAGAALRRAGLYGLLLLFGTACDRASEPRYGDPDDGETVSIPRLKALADRSGATEIRQELRIRGRIKEIIVTSTGEKVPPVDLELALETDPLFAQTFVVGEARPFISFIAVLNTEEWKKLAAKLGVDPNDKLALQSNAVRSAVLKRARAAAAGFPHYALPRNVALTLEPWTIDNGLLTPTLKLKRKPLTDRFAAQIEEMYLSHARA